MPLQNQLSIQQKAAILCALTYALTYEGNPSSEELNQLQKAAISLGISISDSTYVSMVARQNQSEVINILNTLDGGRKAWLAIGFNTIASVTKSHAKLNIGIDICKSIGITQDNFKEIIKNSNRR